ncbi:MAG: ADP-glyceromanno-heptose 6-epimerase [Candidatus Omnitrophota bacterium]
MAKKTVILTGGAGFIGSCFLWRLNREGFNNVVVVDDIRDDLKWKNLLGKQFINYFQKDDFLDILETGDICGVKTIVHLGACSSTVLSDAAYFLKNNYEYSKRLALWADAHGAGFIYASSAATYGNGSNGYDDSEENLDKLRPLNIYGYSKHIFDLWMLRKGLLRKSTGLKFFNVFGPNEYHKGEMMSIICKRFEDVRSGEPLALFKSYHPEYRNGEPSRDFIYVKDAVELLYYFFTNSDKTGIFNVGTGEAHSWNEVAEAMFSALGRMADIKYVEMPPDIRRNYQYFTQASLDKLRGSGCRHKFTSLEEAVKDYSSYLENNGYL